MTAVLHHFTESIEGVVLPSLFTFPFHYTPHPLCIKAAEEVQVYLAGQQQWAAELAEGKMFGVLVVQTPEGEVGFLAAFSGNLAHANRYSYFVPPVFDLLQPDGFFCIEEQQISALNARIDELEGESRYRECKELLADLKVTAERELKKGKLALKASKEARDVRREAIAKDEIALAELIRESQYEKAELNRLKRIRKEEIASLATEIEIFEGGLTRLKEERRLRSAALQRRLFDHFVMRNGRGETRGLCEIFEETVQKLPPAGAGECAAPKLLQYAYLQRMKPLAMAEFWWGASPKMELRRHGHYYPACKGKCEPILKFMLQGLEVEPNPLLNDVHRETVLEVVYEDDWLLVVNKPAGMLSVPGKGDVDSVYSRMRKKYPEATGPLVVHRLDMATSGLLLIAKTKEVHKDLQAQFKDRVIKKRYIALLDGEVMEDEGTVELPLCLDPHDRPRQVVSEEFGKSAVTAYKVVARTGVTRVTFYPATGRTHQLRVHAAHSSGLNAPIRGDELYGRKAERLYLHAEALEFMHPITGKRIRLEKLADF